MLVLTCGFDYEGRDPVRRAGNAPAGRDGVPAQADGRDRRPPDPLAHHEAYAHHGFRDFVLCLGYRGNMIKEYFLNYEAMNNDFTICLGRNRQITYHGDHEEQDFQCHAGRHRPRDDDRRAAQARREVCGRRHVHADLRRRRQRRRYPPRLLEFHKSHGRLATVTTVRPISALRHAGCGDGKRVLEFMEKPVPGRMGQRRVLRFRARASSTIWPATTASWSASRWSGWPQKGSWWPIATTVSSTPWIPTANTSI